jgi:hypothetical protein
MKVIDNRIYRTEDDVLVRGSVIKVTRSGEWMNILLDSVIILLLMVMIAPLSKKISKTV